MVNVLHRPMVYLPGKPPLHPMRLGWAHCQMVIILRRS